MRLLIIPVEPPSGPLCAKNAEMLRDAPADGLRRRGGAGVHSGEGVEEPRIADHSCGLSPSRALAIRALSRHPISRGKGAFVR